jgi:hypothetical protein
MEREERQKYLKEWLDKQHEERMDKDINKKRMNRVEKKINIEDLHVNLD